MKIIPFATALVCLAVAPLHAAFTIDVSYDTSLTTQEQSALDYAVGFWTSRITGYTYDHGLDGLTLYVSDGSFSTPVNGYVWQTNGVEGSVYVAESGIIEIDSASAVSMAAAGTLNNAVARAMGFALGFGMYGTSDSLWNVNALTSSSAAYTGANAIAAYGLGATSLGVATISGIGAKGWTQTGLTNDLLAAVPTDLKSATLSATSLAALKDIGYTVVPEVSPLWLVTPVAGLALLRRRKNSRTKG